MPRKRKETSERKHVRGEGTHWQAGEHRWRGQLPRRRDPVTGKIFRPSVEGRDTKEVFDKLAKLRTELSGSLVSVTSHSKLSDYLLGWLEGKRPSLRPRTGQRYSELLVPIIRSQGDVQLRSLTADHIDSCLAELSRRRKANGDLQWKSATINRMREVLRNALQDANDRGVLTNNAAALSHRLKTVSYNPVVIDDADKMRQFLAAAEGEKFKIASRPHIVALLTGLRVGEICGLKWTDVRGSTLTVNREVQRIRKSLLATMPPSYERWGGLVVLDPKTENSQRSIDVPSKVIEILEEQRAIQAVWRDLAQDAWQENGFIFTTRHGTPVDPNQLLEQLRRILAKAGMERMRFHDLRHSLVTLLSVQGLPAAAILKITGWSNISQLQRYSHHTPAMGAQAVKAIDAVLAESRKKEAL
jgi:integrase